MSDAVKANPPRAVAHSRLHVLYCVEYLLAENSKLGAPGRVPGARVGDTKNALHHPLPRPRFEIARVCHSSRRWPDRP